MVEQAVHTAETEQLLRREDNAREWLGKEEQAARLSMQIDQTVQGDELLRRDIARAEHLQQKVGVCTWFEQVGQGLGPFAHGGGGTHWPYT